MTGYLGDLDAFVQRVREGFRAVTPLGDAMDAARRPEFDVRGRPVVFSPGARRYPVIADTVDRWIDTPTTYPGMKALLGGLDYLRSNGPDRAPLPFRHGGYSEDELRDVYLESGDGIRADRERALAEETQVHDDALTAAVTGPVGVRSVVVHSEAAFQFVPSVPVNRDGVVVRGDLDEHGARQPLTPAGLDALHRSGGFEVGQQTLSAFPVPLHWSSERVVRLSVDRVPLTCEFCAAFDRRVSWKCTEYLKVTCGTVTHVGGVCDACKRILQPPFSPLEDLSFEVVGFDGWHRGVGFCADRHY